MQEQSFAAPELRVMLVLISNEFNYYMNVSAILDFEKTSPSLGSPLYYSFFVRGRFFSGFHNSYMKLFSTTRGLNAPRFEINEQKRLISVSKNLFVLKILSETGFFFQKSPSYFGTFFKNRTKTGTNFAKKTKDVFVTKSRFLLQKLQF